MRAGAWAHQRSPPCVGFSCRKTDALPAAVWITVGGLRQEGATLQLKARRVAKAADRSADGGWCAYVPIGGALSVRDGQVSEA